ncbi:HYR domain-containing protein [Myxococcus sp. CA040A]|uniref:HYR domain-containing protein n=1 Tax=Myxococcus sp. CA040A TaxID=2741738 RepID=UPI0020C63CE7|nr:HYR domain-containing protein [Myxococcus sp. CA040A]
MQSRRVSRYLVVVVGCALVAACEQKQDLPASAEALALARAYFPELTTEEAPSKVFSSSEVPLTVADSRALTSRLSASGTLELTTRGLLFRVEQGAGADDAGTLLRERAVSFAGPRHFWFPVGASAEVSQGWRSSRLEEAWVVDGSEPLHRAEYHVTLPPSVTRLRDVGEYVEFLDTDGQPVLRFHPSEVRDARGESRRGDTRLSGVRASSLANVFEVEGPRVSLVTEVALAGLTAPLVVDPGWSSTASMATPRAQHSSLLLTDGTVLVAGGVNRLGFVTTAERFDPERGTWASAAGPGIQGNIAVGVMLPTGRALVMTDGSLTGRIYDAQTNTWTATGAMAASRSLPTATVLPSGKVLVAGGSNLATAELYDAATNTFTPTAPMAVIHRAHTAVLLRNGRVLVMSGFSNLIPGEVPESELYDPVSETWSLAAPALVPRHYATGTQLPDGRVLLAGGFTAGGVTTHAELYDPAANTWTATGALTHPRNGHTATLLPNGKVLVQGGADAARNTQTVSELYDPATGTWSPAGALAVGRENMVATLLPTGQVLVNGGYASNPSLTFFANADVYDASSDVWAPAGNLAAARASRAAVLLPSGQVLVAGGRGSGGVLATAERYTRASNAWSPAASLATARERATMSLLQSGRVLVVGGANGAGAQASAEQYDATANAWSAAGNLATARDGHTATVLGSGRVFVVGGAGAATAELYDPATNTWSGAASAATPRSRHAAVLLNDGRVLVAGGQNAGALLATAELYDPTTNTWAPAASLAQGRESFTLTVLSSGRVLASAGTTLAAELASAELYDPVSNTWTPAGSLAEARAFHSAVLLPSGRVLVAGGQGPGGAVRATAELYDGATNTWKPATNLAGPRARFAAVVLPTSEVLALGGQSAANAWLASAELYEDTGAQPSWRPVVTGPDEVTRACSARITGARFRGISGASSGDYKDSSADFPLARLQGVEGGRLWSLPGTDLSATGATVTIPASAPPGTYALSIFANGIGSGRLVTVLENIAPVAQDQTVETGYGVPVNVTLVATDTEVGPPLTYVIVTPPANGTLSGTPPAVTYTPNPGYVGPDSFTFMARDCGLDSNVATVTVGVVDETPPTITCPADQQVEATSPAGAVVTYPPATATDVITGNPTVTYAPPSGGTLPLGMTTVTATAEDAAGNQASCTFQVTVRDTTPPTVTCPVNMVVEATGPSGAPVTYPAATASDAVTATPTVTYSPLSGSTLPLGDTTVTATAEDAAGNRATCTFLVTVRDTTPPTVTCPVNMVVEATAPSGALVTYPAATASDAVTASPTVTYSPPSGSTLPLGDTTVTATAEDAAGNRATCTFLVTVRDTTPPTVTCPVNMVVEATAPSGAPVTYPAATASDAVTASPTVTYSPPSGSTLPLGDTTVTATAEDAAGNRATCTFLVTVRDTLPPMLTCPVNQVAEAGTAVTYLPATASDAVTASPTVTYSPPSGSTLPLGDTTVTVTAEDAAGNRATCTFLVTVRDTLPPVLTCPGNQVAEAGTAVTYPPATASDVGSTPLVTYSPPSGSILPLGDTTVTVTAEDAAGNRATCTFLVTVRDTLSPVLTCPADPVVEAQDASGAVVTYEPATVTDGGAADPVVAYSAPSGSTFPLGVTTVTVTADDAAGNRATCTFQVTVRDTTAPTLSCPENLQVASDEPGGAQVTYTLPTATDSVSGPATVTASPESGSRFSSGQTRVTVTATDAAGNTAQCSFEVSVQARLISIAGGGCQSTGGGGDAVLVVLSVLAVWAGRRRGRERVAP